MNIVRQSKFRHVFCKPVKTEQLLSDVRITEITWDSLFCAVNPKFLAIIVKGAGGPFMVFPIKKVGRIEKEYPIVDAHRAPCLEVAWSPFNDNVIASCSEDTTVKVWLIPEGGLLRPLNEPIVELNGHQKRVNTILWHPTANNVLLTAGGDNKILLWNCGTGEALIEIAGHPDQIWSVAFNYDGSRIVTTCKDKNIRVIDPRSGAVLQQGQGHEGVKPQRAIYMKDGRILTTGFTKRSERLYALRDEAALDAPIIQEELDTSNGVLFPLYDEDTGLVFLAGKGDCAIRYYEVNQEYPFVHYITTHTTSEPQRGLAFMPKRGLSVLENEISRIYKVRTSGVVDIMQFFVPRKSDLFQEDLYPDTRGTTPALSPDDWMAGKNAGPVLVPVNAGAAADHKPKATVAKRANILAQMPPPQAEPQPHSPTAQRPPEEAPPAQKQPSPRRPAAAADDDLGIVRYERSPQPQQPSTPQQQTQPNTIVRETPIQPGRQATLKSRGERDGGDGPLTPGQRRAAAELERIKRDKDREPTEADLLPPPTPSGGSARSPRGSISSVSGGGGEMSMEELMSDVQKLKAVIRQHERRIRLLEDHMADKNMADAYGF